MLENAADGTGEENQHMKITVHVLPDGRIADYHETENVSNATAEFEIGSDGCARLLRWPRNTKMAILPEQIEGYIITEIAPLAFASFHFPEKVWNKFCDSSSGSFSTFCIKHGGQMEREENEEGGPVEVYLPDTILRIGAYAFWHCDRLEKIVFPKQLKVLGQGVFGECSRLSEVELPQKLVEIGSFFPRTTFVMPDVGTFSGCHSLKTLVLPRTLRSIGEEVFNSCGLETLIVEDEETKDFSWSRMIQVHRSVFSHAAALQWMARSVNGKIVWQIGLPVARDKILACDKRYHAISQIPNLFFKCTVEEIDTIAKKAFRLDFSGRMAIARLRYPEFLSTDMRNWYRDILIEYYDRLDQFWPGNRYPAEEAFELFKESEGFDAEMLGRLMYIAGREQMKPELIYQMMEYRNTKFASITGLESLML